MRALITAHVFNGSRLLFLLKFSNKAGDGRLGNIAVTDITVIRELAEDGSSGKAWIMRFEITDPLLKIRIKLTRLAFVGPAFRDESIKTMLFIVEIPGFDGIRMVMARFTGSIFDAGGRKGAKELSMRDDVIGTGNERRDGPITHKGDFLLFFWFQRENLLVRNGV